MKYLRPSKYFNQQQVARPGVDMGTAISIGQLISELEQVKESILTLTENKIKEIDQQLKIHISNITDSTKLLEDAHKKVETFTKTVAKGDKGDSVDFDEDRIVARVTNRIPPLNRQDLVNEIISKLPKTDEITQRVLKAIPKNKASLKIIQEKFEVDPMGVIEKIMALPEGKFKLKTAHIDGLEQTMATFRSQLGRGYLHGGGDTVQAGTNITITTSAGGQKVISSTGGSGYTPLFTASTVNGSNTAFIFLTATTQPSIVTSDGIQYLPLTNGGLTNWTWNSGTKTVTLVSPQVTPPTVSIFAIQ